MSKKQVPTIVRHRAFDEILTICRAGEYPFLVGPAGSGKTTIGEQVAIELGLSFAYAGAVESSFQLRGFMDAHGRYQKTPFVKSYEGGGVFLQDEMDSSDPQALVSLNAAIANRLLDTPEGMVKMHPDFKLIAAANTSGRGATIKYSGRNQLDMATLDRYIQVMVDYDPDLEVFIAHKLNGDAAKPMLSLVHQARAASRELKFDEFTEVSTRALVKGINLMKAGMTLERAFSLAVLDKLDEGNVIKLMKRMDMSLKDFHAKVDPTALDKFSAEIRQVADLVAALERQDGEIRAVLSEGKGTLTKAMTLAGRVGTGISGAEVTIGRLQQVSEMLVGLEKAGPAIEGAVLRFIEDIKPHLPSPK